MVERKTFYTEPEYFNKTFVKEVYENRTDESIRQRLNDVPTVEETAVYLLGSMVMVISDYWKSKNSKNNFSKNVYDSIYFNRTVLLSSSYFYV